MNLEALKNQPPGYIPEIITSDHAIFNMIFLEDVDRVQGTPMNWKQWLPPFESQQPYPICVSASRTNCAETLSNALGIGGDLSERRLAQIGGTTLQGARLHDVSEAGRIQGIPKEGDCPFTDRLHTYWLWEEFMQAPDLAGKPLYYLGSHSWVFGQDAARAALNDSPLQIAFPIGETYNNDIITPPKNIYVYHAAECFWIDDFNRWHIYDTLDPNKPFKILSADYPITGIKAFRDLPIDWKEKNSMQGFFTLSHDGKTLLAVVAIGDATDVSGIGKMINAQVVKNTDGSINWDEFRKTWKPVDSI